MVFFSGNDWKNLGREQNMPWLATALDPDTDFGPIDRSDPEIDIARDKFAQWWGGTTLSWRDYLRNQPLCARRAFQRQRFDMRLQPMQSWGF